MTIEIPEYYGFAWAKRPPNPKRCIVSVHDTGRSVGFHQCEKKRGYGPEGLYCSVHNPVKVAERDAKRNANYNAQNQIRQRESENAAVGDRLRTRYPELFAELLKEWRS